MEIILIIILLILMCPVDIKNSNHDEAERSTVPNKHFHKREFGKDDIDSFEEADSLFDLDGNEHLIDDEGYCEECDDYHDWD